jgi:S1-C subfamily serine protease
MPNSNSTITAKKEEKIFGSSFEHQGDRSYSKIIPLVIVISFIFGAAGAAFGDRFLGQFGSSGIGSGTTTDVTTVQVNEQSAVVDVVKRASPAVVSIIISKDLNKIPGFSTSPFDFDDLFGQPNIQEVGGGSGFIITADGLIATNKHVVDDEAATYTVLTNDGKRYDAEVLSRDPVNDLALVKIEGSNLPTVALGDSSDLDIGQRVLAICN